MNGSNARWRKLGPSLLLGAMLACQSPSENEVGPVCPQCGPSSGGETGDFGPSQVDCWPYLEPADLAQAEVDGLDVTEFAEGLAQTLELPMSWKPEEWGSRTVEARGYEEHTQVSASFSRSGPVRYQRINRAACGATCGCASFLEAAVRIDLQTEDRAVHATLRGIAQRALLFRTDDAGPYHTSLNARADLREVVGTLRFAAPGGEFHGSLILGMHLGHGEGEGSLSVRLQVEREEDRAWDGSWITRAHALSVYGAFPSAPPSERSR